MLLLAFLFLAASVLPCAPARAWSPPGCDSTEDRRADTSVEPGRTYHEKAHAYIIEHAIDILRNDGYDNWAEVAWQNRQDLLDGVMWADNAGKRVRIVGYHRVLWEVWEAWSWSPCNEASLDHFHNPDRDKPGHAPGLNLAGWGVLKNALGGAFATAFTTAGTAGIYSHTVTVEPDIFHQNKSAADQCQAYYQKATQAYNGQGTLPNRSNLQTAMFYLGWSAHLLGDLGVTQHTWDNWITHDDYEHYANGLGDVTGYHATTARNPSSGIDAYQFNWTARRFATEMAKRVHTWEQFQWAEGEGAKNTISDDIARLAGARGVRHFHNALAASMPYIEMYTAGLIAKFMKEIGVPEKAPALRGAVLDSSGKPIPGAYVFYRRGVPVHRAPAAGAPSQTGTTTLKPEAGPWDFVRADQQGNYTLGALVPNQSYLIRPAMPGYFFEGSAAGQGGGLSEFMTQSPVPYTHQYGLSAPGLNFYLRQAPAPQPQMAMNPQLAQRPPALWLPTTTFQPQLIAPNTALPQSGDQVSLRLAENLHRAMIHVNANSYALDVANGGTGLPAQAYVTVQLYRLMDAHTGAVLHSPQQVLQAVDAGRAAFKAAVASRQPSQALPEPQFSNQAITLLGQSLPSTQVTGPDGSQKTALVLPSACDGFPSADSLLSAGVIPLPSLAGAEVRVEVAPGPGYVGTTPSAPITLVTSPSGQAAFTIKAGSEAGKLRVNLKVLKHPAATQILPQDAVEFMVHPALVGPDAGYTAPPTLAVAPLMMTAVAIQPIQPPGPQAQIQPPGAAQAITPIPVQPTPPQPVAPTPQVAPVPGQVLQPMPGQVIQPIPTQPQQPAPGVQPGVQQPVPGPQPGPQQPVIVQPMPAQPLPGQAPQPGAVPASPQPGQGLSQNFNSQPIQGWEFGGGAQVAQVGGSPALTFASPGHAFWIAASARDLTLSFRMLLGQGVSEIVFCASGEPPQGGAYHLILGPDEYGLDREASGQRQNLSGAPSQLQPGQWHNVSLQVSNGSIQVTVDGRTLLTAQDPQPLATGVLGFGCAFGSGLAYDDIVLSPSGGTQVLQQVQPHILQQVGPQPGPQPGPQQPVLVQPMAAQPLPGQAPQPGAARPQPGQAVTQNFNSQPVQGWEFGGGAQIGQVGGSPALTFTSPGHGIWVVPSARDFALDVRMLLGQGAGEIVFCASGEPPRNSEYHLIIAPGECGLDKQVPGQRQSLTGAPCQFQPGQWHNVSVQVANGSIQVTVDGQTLLTVQDPQPLSAGIFAFGCMDGTGFAYDDIAVSVSQSQQSW
jgi:hypothetical protein